MTVRPTRLGPRFVAIALLQRCLERTQLVAVHGWNLRAAGANKNMLRSADLRYGQVRR